MQEARPRLPEPGSRRLSRSTPTAQEHKDANDKDRHKTTDRTTTKTRSSAAGASGCNQQSQAKAPKKAPAARATPPPSLGLEAKKEETKEPQRQKNPTPTHPKKPEQTRGTTQGKTHCRPALGWRLAAEGCPAAERQRRRQTRGPQDWTTTQLTDPTRERRRLQR